MSRYYSIHRYSKEIIDTSVKYIGPFDTFRYCTRDHVAWQSFTNSARFFGVRTIVKSSDMLAVSKHYFGVSEKAV